MGNTIIVILAAPTVFFFCMVRYRSLLKHLLKDVNKTEYFLHRIYIMKREIQRCQ